MNLNHLICDGYMIISQVIIPLQHSPEALCSCAVRATYGLSCACRCWKPSSDTPHRPSSLPRAPSDGVSSDLRTW